MGSCRFSPHYLQVITLGVLDAYRMSERSLKPWARHFTGFQSFWGFLGLGFRILGTFHAYRVCTVVVSEEQGPIFCCAENRPFLISGSQPFLSYPSLSHDRHAHADPKSTVPTDLTLVLYSHKTDRATISQYNLPVKSSPSGNPLVRSQDVIISRGSRRNRSERRETGEGSREAEHRNTRPQQKIHGWLRNPKATKNIVHPDVPVTCRNRQHRWLIQV
jgi:hypothetical protein